MVDEKVFDSDNKLSVEDIRVIKGIFEEQAKIYLGQVNSDVRKSFLRDAVDSNNRLCVEIKNMGGHIISTNSVLIDSILSKRKLYHDLLGKKRSVHEVNGLTIQDYCDLLERHLNEVHEHLLLNVVSALSGSINTFCKSEIEKVKHLVERVNAKLFE